MPQSSQTRALANYRDRLSKRGLVRFEILAPERDRDLIRAIARCLTESNDEATRVRANLTTAIAGEPPPQGGILAALRRSPLVGAELELEREVTFGRPVDL